MLYIFKKTQPAKFASPPCRVFYIGLKRTVKKQVFGYIDVNRTVYFLSRNFFENFFSPNWKPIFGLSHSNKIHFGNGKGISHGFEFNLGPKPMYKTNQNLEILQDESPGTQPKRALRAMTIPFSSKNIENNRKKKLLDSYPWKK